MNEKMCNKYNAIHGISSHWYFLVLIALNGYIPILVTLFDLPACYFDIAVLLSSNADKNNVGS